jgi:hypothetical protein
MAVTFQEQVKKFTSIVEPRMRNVSVKVGLDLHKVIVKKTIVDTGRLKAGNQLMPGSKPTGSTTDTDKTGAGTLAKGIANMKSYKLGDDIWICNNVEYAYPVEMGFRGKSGGHRGAGFFRTSVDDIISQWPNIVQEVKSAT